MFLKNLSYLRNYKKIYIFDILNEKTKKFIFNIKEKNALIIFRQDSLNESDLNFFNKIKIEYKIFSWQFFNKNIFLMWISHKLSLNESVSYNNVMGELLKDTGIKTKVIKQYIPVINKLVNQYLQVLDFFVHFNLDESFNETIRSRHRDAFSYDSFSEGEKQRIDLALLFTWRQIAKMKNSVATNLLLLDETFDSSLDHDGVENLMKILHTLDDQTNVFVISHKGEILDSKFKEKLEFVKEKNFSKLVA